MQINYTLKGLRRGFFLKNGFISLELGENSLEITHEIFIQIKNGLDEYVQKGLLSYKVIENTKPVTIKAVKSTRDGDTLDTQNDNAGINQANS